MTTESDLAPTSALLRDVFPGAPVADLDYLRWLYLESPFGSVIETNTEDDQGLTGHYAIVPMDLSADGVACRGALSLNTAVAERARGGGMFVKLASSTLEQAARLGIETVLGVANANSTPGFIRRLEFELVTPLPATVMLPIPLRGSRGWETAPASTAAGWLEAAAPLLDAAGSGLGRTWNTTTLAWRLRCPGRDYMLHRRDGILAVSILAHQGPIRVAVLLKVFARQTLTGRDITGLVNSASRAHRAPLVLHVGLNDRFVPKGLTLPERLRPSPLNLIRRDLAASTPKAPITRLEFLDFDAY